MRSEKAAGHFGHSERRHTGAWRPELTGAARLRDPVNRTLATERIENLSRLWNDSRRNLKKGEQRVNSRQH
jgi:hypothetical protein